MKWIKEKDLGNIGIQLFKACYLASDNQNSLRWDINYKTWNVNLNSPITEKEKV